VPGLMRWLGEDFDPVQLDHNSFHHQGRSGSPNVHRTTTEHTESVGRWKELLTPSEAERIYQKCDPLWRRVSSVDIDEASASPRKKDSYVASGSGPLK
jgi:hypothetical protein